MVAKDKELKKKNTKKKAAKSQIKNNQTGLTDKEERFCYEYVLHLNASKAACLAGYSERSSRVTASRLLTKVNIQDRIRQMRDNLAETAQISALKIVKEHDKIAFSSIAHLHKTWIERTEFESLTEDQKACIRSITTKLMKKNVGTKDDPDIVDVEYVKIELYDKQKSLDSLSEMLGFNAPVKQEITGKDGKDLIPEMNLAQLSDEELITYYSLLNKASQK